MFASIKNPWSMQYIAKKEIMDFHLIGGTQWHV